VGIVIRVLFNNQSWQAPCKRPGSDPLCWQCLTTSNLGIKTPGKEDEICTGHCWEQHICEEYRWGCNPRGKIFGSRAYPGQKVFFAYQQPDKNYTLWGRATVTGVDNKPMEGEREDDAGYAFIHFDSFIPMPKEKWVSNLSDTRLVGKKWLMGRYRFIDNERETYIENLIEGLIPEKQPASTDITQLANNTVLNLSLAPNIYQKLDAIANDEGRKLDDVVKEAIAEWLKTRK
jgi:hypothetical protein